MADAPETEAIGRGDQESADNADEAGSGGRGRRRRSTRGSRTYRIPGSRDMKEYPIYAHELWELGRTGLFATLAFSLAAGLFGLSFDINKDLALTNGIDPAVRGYWEGIGGGALYGSIIFAGLGLIAVVVGGLKVRAIINSTDHDD